MRRFTVLIFLCAVTLSACGNVRARGRLSGGGGGGGGAVNGQGQNGDNMGADGQNDQGPSEGEGEAPGEGEGEGEGNSGELPPECVDEDGDGFPGGPEPECPATDCDDGDRFSNPARPEICDNGFDDDCDGDFDGSDEDCRGGENECVDADSDRYGVGTGCLGRDCDERDPLVNEGMEEKCGDGVDNNCNGLVDEDCQGGGPGGGLTCWEFVECQGECEEDAACAQRCAENISPIGRQIYLNIDECILNNCPAGADSNCPYERCGDFIRQCIFDGGNQLSCATGYSCLMTCTNQNVGCQQECSNAMSAPASSSLNDMLLCFEMNCAAAADFQTCAQNQCDAEITACFGAP